MTDHRIHITGASGSGTTTLGAALAARLACAHIDTDNYYWAPSDPPFQAPAPMPARLAALEDALEGHSSWVLSGSLMGWGDPLIPRFSLVVFLQVPPEVRLPRLKRREQGRYGERIAPDGPMADQHAAFMAWAAGYDDAAFTGRSLQRHLAWLDGIACPVVRIEGAPTHDESLAQVLAALPG